MAITLRAPAPGTAGAAFGRAMLEYAPMTTAMAFLYTTVSCQAQDIRGKDDWKNPFYGGAAAGAFTFAVKRRSIAAAIAGGLLMGGVAASPSLFQIMSQTLEENSSRRFSPASVAMTPSAFATQSQSAQSVQRRLL